MKEKSTVSGKVNIAASQRETGIEILRLLSMAMIIALHYITKSGVKIPLYREQSLRMYFWSFIEALSSVSVNVYVLISGYFAVDSRWKAGKLLKLWLQIMFYSLGVALILVISGVVKADSLDFGIWQQILMPVSYEHYWFGTAFIMLYIISPVLAKGAYALDKKTYSIVLGLLVAVFSLWKSINPYLIPWDKYGCDLVWFAVLFLTAVYLRRFVFEKQEKGTKILNSVGGSLTVYIVFGLITYLASIISGFIAFKTGKLWYYCDMTYSYNYITVYMASIGLFAFFKNLKIKYNPIINKMAAGCFGVYLLHDHVLIRNLWQSFLGIDFVMGRPLQPVHLLICIIILMTIGIGVDSIRLKLEKIIFKYINRMNS